MGTPPHGSRLPNAKHLQIDRSKIVDYLLSDENGRGKAGFFRRLGFHPKHWQALAEALKEHGRLNPISSEFDSGFGTRYVVEGPLDSPDHRNPPAHVASIWILEPGARSPRLITAFPA